MITLTATFMEASKSLRQPINWQDFETLCKKLWGEIWDCPEIKKNGRAGQNQFGIDIYGIPKGENEYYGIQCKGKDEYSKKQFTEAEILKEIENAKNFKPFLKKLYFTTTAQKDVHIETFVRKINLEHIKIGLFEVHLFSWEDIVDLIDENRQTHDWYLKSQKFKNKKEVKISFSDNSKLIECNVLFIKVENTNIQRIFNPNLNSNSIFEGIDPSILKISGITEFPNTNVSVNLSYFGFKLRIQNTGTDPLEDYSLKLEFEGQIIDIAETNQISGFPFIKSVHDTTSIDHINKTVRITPKSMLVGSDEFITEEIFVKPKIDETKILIKWKLLSKDFTDNGELFINSKVEFEIFSPSELIEYDSLVGNKIDDFYEYLIPKSALD